MTVNTDTENMKNEKINDEVTSTDAVETTDEIVMLEPSVEDQLAEMKDQWLRAVAESENIRRRAQRDKEDTTRYASLSLARDVVGVSDNLRRAVEACEKEDRTQLSPSVQGLVAGVELIIKELDKIFDKNSIKRIHPLHEKFDPNFHQAMFEIESNEYPAGTVMTVMQDGYVLHDRLLRAAMVGVSKAQVIASTDHLDEVV